MLRRAYTIDEIRDLAMRDLSLLIRAASVAFRCRYVSIASSHHSGSMPLVQRCRMPCLSAPLSLQTVPAVCNVLIVRISGIPSLGCPRGRLAVSSANVRCSGSGRRAVEERFQLGQPVVINTDLHYKSPTQRCTPRS